MMSEERFREVIDRLVGKIFDRRSIVDDFIKCSSIKSYIALHRFRQFRASRILNSYYNSDLFNINIFYDYSTNHYTNMIIDGVDTLSLDIIIEEHSGKENVYQYVRDYFYNNIVITTRGLFNIVFDTDTYLVDKMIELFTRAYIVEKDVLIREFRVMGTTGSGYSVLFNIVFSGRYFKYNVSFDAKYEDDDLLVRASFIGIKPTYNIDSQIIYRNSSNNVLEEDIESYDEEVLNILDKVGEHIIDSIINEKTIEYIISPLIAFI